MKVLYLKYNSGLVYFSEFQTGTYTLADTNVRFILGDIPERLPKPKNNEVIKLIFENGVLRLPRIRFVDFNKDDIIKMCDNKVKVLYIGETWTLIGMSSLFLDSLFIRNKDYAIKMVKESDISFQDGSPFLKVIEE